MKNRKSIVLDTIKGDSVEEKLRIAKEAGFAAVEGRDIASAVRVSCGEERFQTLLRRSDVFRERRNIDTRRLTGQIGADEEPVAVGLGRRGRQCAVQFSGFDDRIHGLLRAGRYGRLFRKARLR